MYILRTEGGGSKNPKIVGLYERVLKFKPQIDTVGRPLSHDIFISVLLTCSTVVV